MAAMPRGGRPLVIAKAIPACRKAATASIDAAVSDLAFVTKVPSISDKTSLIS
jgi:hypothetical protein